MTFQEDEKYFEFFGFDIVADEDMTCWLIEVNRLPGLESSHNNLQEEDEMYNEMMTNVLRIILYPYLKERYLRECQDQSFEEKQHLIEKYSSIPLGHWTNVTGDATMNPDYSIVFRRTNEGPPASSENLSYQNLLKWKMFTRLHRKKILSTFSHQ